jgi:hypothetical protein
MINAPALIDRSISNLGGIDSSGPAKRVLRSFFERFVKSTIIQE